MAEANQGGAMVETTIRTVDANVSFKGVHASRGKITRAEPVAALSEQHRILFLGAFPELEDQLCTFEAGSADSPDRLDALVWAFTELMVEFQVPDIPIVMPVIISKAEAGSSIPGRRITSAANYRLLIATRGSKVLYKSKESVLTTAVEEARATLARLNEGARSLSE